MPTSLTYDDLLLVADLERPRLLRAAARIVGDAFAEDIVQDTLVSIFERGSLASLKDPAAVVGWLQTAVERRAHDWQDHEAGQDRGTLAYVARDTAPAAPALDPYVSKQIDRLPAKQRDALLATHYHGLTVREYAAVSGVPRVTVQRQIAAALDSLGPNTPSAPSLVRTNQEEVA